MIHEAALILAQVATSCAPTVDLHDQLLQKYGEERLFAGLSGQSVIELWSNPETGTWTIIVSTPEGMSCLLASGENAVHFNRKPNV